MRKVRVSVSDIICFGVRVAVSDSMYVRRVKVRVSDAICLGVRVSVSDSFCVRLRSGLGLVMVFA